MPNAKLEEYIRELCAGARKAAPSIAAAPDRKKNEVLSAVAHALRERAGEIIAANARDLVAAEAAGIPAPMLDRLTLDLRRIDGIADAVLAVAALPTPVGAGECFTRPNGLQIRHVRVPLGVVAMIYESRPNVTADAAALCIKTGNAVILRGGSEAIHSNRAIVEIIRAALYVSGVNPGAVSLVDTTDRAAADMLLTMKGAIDVLIPRGGAGLIRHVVDHATVPVIETGAGNCHLYVDAAADLAMALRVTMNAKTSRPSVCNAIETLLVHEAVAGEFLPRLGAEASAVGLELRGCERTRAFLPGIAPATAEDYATEYDDMILAVRVVPDEEEAIRHIARYSTGHSEAIITGNLAAAERFTSAIDAAAVYVNASTRFTDGGEFGLGAEIGISTQKLHVRGPMGLSALTTDKYIILGQGQIR